MTKDEYKSCIYIFLALPVYVFQRDTELVHWWCSEVSILSLQSNGAPVIFSFSSPSYLEPTCWYHSQNSHSP